MNLLIITSAIIIFLLVTIIIVAILLYAKSKLIPQFKVKIKINDEQIIETDSGSSLLTSLRDNNIYLPSACGGGGTCGLCKCRVIEGGGNILPTETNFFNRKEQQNNWRLACQVKVKNDMNIIVPKEILNVKKREAEIISTKNIATFIKEIVIKLPQNEVLTFQSGDYIQIDVPKFSFNYANNIIVDDSFKKEWDILKLWNFKVNNSEETCRAYSLANSPVDNSTLVLNVRIALPNFNISKNKFEKYNPGVCSSYLFSLKQGDKINVSGPFGDFHLKDSDNEMMFIGGGAGMAPLRSHINYIFNTLKTNRKVSFWYGARSKNELFYENEFYNLQKQYQNFKFNIALSEPKQEDEWKGYTGFIHKVILDNYLAQHKNPENIEYYLCGPPQMTEAVLNMLDALGVDKEMIAFDDFNSSNNYENN